ncbi:cyclic nucleotide-binding domain-containing protein [Actinomadura sp. 9N215]|uniref:cyclic nucleotide-binding domain-containing protein n=1 Tax=Actinomadura sp. 9N215 TaxID=3375150 RepID=UPI00378BA8FA
MDDYGRQDDHVRQHDHSRQHDPDQIVASETGPADVARQAHDEPETEIEIEAERRDVNGPQPLVPTRPVSPPPRPGFWGSLTDVERNDLLAYTDEVVYPVGTVLWFEGQTADQAVVIQSGSVRVSVNRDGHERIIAFRGPGDIIGERAALLLRRRSATIVAMDTLRGLRMTTQQFAAYLSAHPRVVAVMEREVYDRLTEQTGPPPQPLTPQPLTHQPPTSQPLTSQPPTSQPLAPPQYATNDQYWPNAPHDPAVQYRSIAPGGAAPQYGAPPHGHGGSATGRQVPITQYDTQAYAALPMPFAGADHVQQGPAYGGPANGADHVQQGPAYGGPGNLVPPQRNASWQPVQPAQQAQPSPNDAAPGPFEDEPTQPMTVTPPGPAGATWAGQNCTIVYTDIAGFSDTRRNDLDRLEMRRAMYALLREAFGESAVPWDACHVEDRGDGALIVVPAEVPTAAVIDPMIATLAARLRRHNQRSSGAVRIQLRVAVHVGPVMPDPPGVAGWALIRTARLLDARPLKDRLAATGADLGFIASTFVYESVIAHSPGFVNAADYAPITCKVKKLKTEGWIHLRGVPAQSAV